MAIPRTFVTILAAAATAHSYAFQRYSEPNCGGNELGEINVYDESCATPKDVGWSSFRLTAYSDESAQGNWMLRMYGDGSNCIGDTVYGPVACTESQYNTISPDGSPGGLHIGDCYNTNGIANSASNDLT